MNKEHPLLEKIHEIKEHSDTGFLPLTHNQGVMRIYFQNGLVDAVSSDLDEWRLGHYLLNEGMIDRSGLNRLVKRSRRQKTALGETVVQLGIIESWELRQLLRQQIAQLVRRALENSFEIWNFTEAPAAHKLSAQMELDALLLQLARNDSEPLEAAHDQRFVLKPGKRASTFPWSPQEMSLLIQLQNSPTLGALVRETGSEEETVRKRLRVFQQLDLIEIPSGSFPETPADARQEGALPEFFIPEIGESACSPKLELLKNEPSFVSEQFRSLKTCIREIQAQRSVQVLCITSARMHDGKSLVSSNLALTLSKDPGRRVILLDCDFRNPSVQRYFDVDLEPGLIGCLQEGEVNPYCYMRRVGRLYIMSAGGIAENPVELLSHPRMRKLIENLKKEFDTLVLDSPPFEPISDVRIISGLADGILMVIRSGKTPYRSVERALKQIDRKKLLGAVFNDVKPLKFHTYHDHRYYGKGNGYYYGRRNGYIAKAKKHTNQTA